MYALDSPGNVSKVLIVVVLSRDDRTMRGAKQESQKRRCAAGFRLSVARGCWLRSPFWSLTARRLAQPPECTLNANAGQQQEPITKEFQGAALISSATIMPIFRRVPRCGRSLAVGFEVGLMNEPHAKTLGLAELKTVPLYRSKWHAICDLIRVIRVCLWHAVVPYTEFPAPEMRRAC